MGNDIRVPYIYIINVIILIFSLIPLLRCNIVPENNTVNVNECYLS